mgnify:CR=1 FL=1
MLDGHIDVPKDRLHGIVAALPEHIRLTRAEPGCLRFDVQADPDVPGRFIVSEEFTDRAAFEAHQTRAAGSEWARISDGIPRTYEIKER